VVPARTGVPRRALRVAAAAIAALGAALILAGTAAAQQASLVESIPADGAELNEPPSEIVLTFDSELGDAFSVQVACNNDPFSAISRPVLSEDRLTLTVDVTEPMPVGECTVAWQVSQPTGEATTDRFSFTVLSSTAVDPGATTVPGATTPPTTPAAGTDTSDDDVIVDDASEVSDGATWLGRVLSTLGLAVLFGSLALIIAAWPEGPEYILAVRFLRSVWLLTLAGTVLFVVALSAAVRGESFGTGLNPAGWLDLLDAGWSGRAALARLVLVVACAWVVMRPERVIDPTTQLPAIAIPTLAVVTIGLSRTGGDLAIIGVMAGIAHALAMAVWVGGVVLLARVVLAGPGEEDLVHAVRGFGRISGPAIVITVVSGLVQLYRLDGGSLFREPHGRVLLLKTVFVALMLFVGLTARQVAQARLARAADLAPPTADRLRRAFGTEAVVGVIVLGLSGWLLSFTPGKVDTDEVDYAIEETIVDEANGLDITVSLDPGRVGQNALRVEVREPEADITGLMLTFVPPTGSSAPTIEQPISLSGRGVAASPDGGGIPLSVPGAWTLQVSATTPIGTSTASNPFDVRSASGDIVTPGIGSTPVQPAVTAATTTSTSTTTPG
jgi:copper transport protein